MLNFPRVSNLQLHLRTSVWYITQNTQHAYYTSGKKESTAPMNYLATSTSPLRCLCWTETTVCYVSVLLQTPQPRKTLSTVHSITHIGTHTHTNLCNVQYAYYYCNPTLQYTFLVYYSVFTIPISLIHEWSDSSQVSTAPKGHSDDTRHNGTAWARMLGYKQCGIPSFGRNM